ncbi:hypothetical protein F3Y22_tig00111166pilonHSYRG00224 [Hibiscus syriacus]|uniref:Reverse transcriptase domain-containing protein n=1 Tax=Hibiscus syriacus TaxID=106335 RepID=A0A6A2YWJ9_HIBSY|nr:hypothetical protein F3Y22_tig00111166pilonHSYRG00224 [Hibiscus syriacus]
MPWKPISYNDCGRFGHSVKYCLLGKKLSKFGGLRNLLWEPSWMCLADASIVEACVKIPVAIKDTRRIDFGDLVALTEACLEPVASAYEWEWLRRLRKGVPLSSDILCIIDPDYLVGAPLENSGRKLKGVALGVIKIVQELKMKKMSMLTRQLWDQLRNAESIIGNDPWLIGGDFNIILKLDESSNPVNSSIISDISDFQNCAEDLRAFPSSEVEFQAPGDSDHSPTLVWMQREALTAMPKPFKFFNFWVLHPGFLTIVKDYWHLPVTGNPTQVLFLKLKRLKYYLKHLNKAHLSDISGQVQKKRDELRAVQLTNLDTAGSIVSDELKIENELRALEKMELIFYEQKMNVDWIKEGDQSTRFFYSMMASRRSSSTIQVLYDHDGSKLSTFDAMSNEAINFFYKQLGMADPEVNCCNVNTIKELLGYSLPEDASESLTRYVSDTEIKEAIWGQGNNKSPGPDGYNYLFFKRTWHIIGSDFLKAISLLNTAALKGVFNFHPKCKKVGLTHLCFADDLLVFCKGSLDFVIAKGAQVSWKKICLMKSEVGLGVQAVGDWNKACVVHLIRKLLANEGSLWVAWIRAYVIGSDDFWRMNTPMNMSWSFKYILKIKPSVSHLFAGPDRNLSIRSIWEDLRARAPKVPWQHVVWFPGLSVGTICSLVVSSLKTYGELFLLFVVYIGGLDDGMVSWLGQPTASRDIKDTLRIRMEGRAINRSDPSNAVMCAN